MPLNKFINNILGSEIAAIYTYLKPPEPKIMIEYNDQHTSVHQYSTLIDLLNKAKNNTSMALSAQLREEILKDSQGLLTIDEKGKCKVANEELANDFFNQTPPAENTLTEDEKKIASARSEHLTWYKLEGYFDSIAEAALKMIEENPTSKILSLGQTPAWVVKAAERISTLRHSNQKFGYIPFSGNFYDAINDDDSKDLEFSPRNFKPDSTLEKSYREVLSNLGISPKEITSSYKIHNIKTSIFDFINTGGGLVSFLSTLFSWAKQEGIPSEEMKSAIEVILLVTSDKEAKNSLKFDGISIACKAQIIEEIWELANGIDQGVYSDRIVPRYPYQDWAKEPQNITENINFLKELNDKLEAAIVKQLGIETTIEVENHITDILNTTDYTMEESNDALSVAGELPAELSDQE